MAAAPERQDAAAARRRLLPEGRVAGPMPWIIAIMMFLTILSAAAALGLGAAVRSMSADLAGRASVQIVEANAENRTALAAKVLAALEGSADVRRAKAVDPATLADQLRPWLGEEATSGDLPIPALIDIDLAPGDADARIGRVRQLLSDLSAKVRLDPHAAFLQPLAGLLVAFGWLAIGIVLLMALATGAVVVLAARGAHDSHKATIDVLHLMGATDVQIARLFQRRIGLDALFGCAIGFVAALIVLAFLGWRLGSTGSDLLGSVSLPWRGWLLLVALPVTGAILATVAARWTVLRALGRSL
ncbi:MAG: cell division protein [Sphingobium sp.]